MCDTQTRTTLIYILEPKLEPTLQHIKCHPQSVEVEILWKVSKVPFTYIHYKNSASSALQFGIIGTT
jgi:hypothetical protein